VPQVRKFATARDAIADLEARPRRCVFKANASAGETFVGVMPDGSDVAALLASIQLPDASAFILMDFVAGIETGVGAYFNGEAFMRPACLDWEHKRFFAGDMGELTGEMGTVATFDRSDAIFDATLKPLQPLLRKAGHVGWVNLNTIVNEQGIWPIEFTCRFGYPGFAVLEPLQRLSWAELFQALLTKRERFDALPGFSVGVVLTTPPFPYSRHEVDAPVGLPLRVDGIDPAHLHLGEVGRLGDRLVTAGVYGWTAVVTGTGATIAQAKADAYANAAKVRAPNLRYRLDIGDKLIAEDLDNLASWGWLSAS
jgi:phosphoribosylamine--glycine ligase